MRLLYLYAAPALLFFAVSMQSCTKKLAVAEEEKPTLYDGYVEKASNIIVPLKIRLDDVARMANEKMPAVLYEDNNSSDDYVTARVVPGGKLSVSTERGALVMRLPLHANARVEYTISAWPGGPQTTVGKNLAGDIVVTTRSYISLSPDWKLKTTTSAGYEWINPPKLLGMPIGLDKLGDLIIKPKMGDINRLIDKSIAEQVDIKSPVAEAWKALQAPILLDEPTQTWLQIRPNAIEMGRLDMRNNEVNVKLALVSYLNIVSGQKPPTLPTVPLAPLRLNENIDDVFNISLPGQIGYEAATGLASAYLAGQTFTYSGGKYKIDVNALGIEPYKNNMLTIWADVKGTQGKLFKKKVTGRVYLHGRPYYDAPSGEIRMKDVSYSLDTRNALARAGAWILKAGFDQQLKNQLRFPVKQQLKETEDMVKARLKQRTGLNKYVSLTGDLYSITPIGVYVTPAGIMAVVEARGSVLVDILR